MSIAVRSRALDGVEIPEPGVWQIDASHSSVEFTVRHLMVAKVRGRFGRLDGAIAVGETPEQSSVAVTIAADSIDTKDPRRDQHLRSPDFFDVETYPRLTFTSTGFTRTGSTTFELPGELTIRGVTRPVVLQGQYEGITPDPWGKSRIAFSARTEIDREDWGLNWNQALETGGVLVGKRVTIELDVQAVSPE